MSKLDEQDYTKRFDMEVWKRVFSYAKNAKVWMFTMLGFVALIAVSETILPLFSGYAVDNFIVNQDFSKLKVFIVSAIVLVIINVILIYGFIAIAGIVEGYICRDIRQACFENLQKLSFSYYDDTPVGWIMARTTSDISKIGSLITWGLIDLFWGIVMVIFLTVTMFILNWRLALILVFLMPILGFIGFKFQNKILTGHREARKVNSKITGAFNEGLTGAKTTKTLGSGEIVNNEFTVLTSEMRIKSIRVMTVSAIFLPLVTFVGSIGTAFVLVNGANQVIVGSIEIGVLVVFLSYVGQIFEPINQIARIFSELQSAQASAERVISLVDTTPTIVDTAEVIEKYGDTLNPKYENYEPMFGEIEFENVNFSYDDKKQILSNVNLKVEKGQKIAFVGETGGGKTTMLNLICRFYEPTAGVIKIDGVDYKKRSQGWLHSNISYVLQTPHLFSGTIRDNIKYGKLDATEEEIISACKLVDAYDFIMEFKDGLDTEVGEGGNRLSQGQKQLVSFARSIIGDPKIYILDEATSSIDTITESKIQNAIDKVLSGRTSFIVAHRLSTIRNADRIIFIKGGILLEDGSHDELLAKKGYYYDLYMSQFKTEQLQKYFNLSDE